MDEVHYLSDRFRGAVWEEVIIHLPESVTLVSLSATVSNAEEFGDWLDTVRGDTEVIVSEHRPVPLWQHVLAGRRMYDLFEERGPAPRRRPAARSTPTWSGWPATENLRGAGPRDRRRGSDADRDRERSASAAGSGRPSRAEVIDRLDAEGLLPAITFIFSRAGCEAAVQQCLHAGLRLNDDDGAAQGPRDRRGADRRHPRRGPARPRLLRVAGGRWSAASPPTTPGMLPTFKEVVEELFVRGLVKAVFATETLALGINMPARSVVLEKLVKWNGETHADITPGEYTQLTGRAGRRGIDVEGHAVVLWQRGLDPAALAGLAGTRTYPLRSSFKPSYNMAVNLVGQFGRHRSRELLETSFAQFQADRSVVGISRQVQRNEEGLDGLPRGDDLPPRRLRGVRAAAPRPQGPGDRPVAGRAPPSAGPAAADVAGEAQAGRRHPRPDRQVRRARPGARPGRAGRSAATAHRRDGEYHDGPRPLVLTAERQVKRLAAIDFPVPVEALDRMRIPKSFNPRSPQSRRDLASALRTKAGHRRAAPAAPQGPRRGGRRHRDRPAAHRAPRRTRATAATSARTTPAGPSATTGCSRDTEQLERRIEGRTNTIARTFDRVCALLTELGYLRGRQGHRTTAAGWPGSTASWTCWPASACATGSGRASAPAELAACVSALVYESRQADDAVAPKLPNGNARDGARRDGADLGPAGRPGGGPQDQPDGGRRPARARPRLRLAGLPLGVRPRAWTRCCATPTCRPATSCAGPSS